MPAPETAPDAAPGSLWRGRFLALAGIVLVAASLRLAVASLSPLVGMIGQSFDLPPAVVGLIGTAPPVCFAIFGFITPWLAQRVGLEPLVTIALLVITLGTATRAMASDATVLLIGTATLFAGVGIGNILLPPLVKKYFPDRIGLMMTIYTTMMAIVTTLPALVAVPLATAIDWRVSLGIWTVVSAVAMVPWLMMVLQERVAKRSPVSTATGAVSVVEPDASTMSRLVKLPLVWAIIGVMSTSSGVAYAMFAWLPQILMDQTGMSALAAGSLLAVFGALGLPASLLVPLLVVRFQATRGIVLVAVIATITGLAGMAFVPRLAPLLWVILIGFAAAALFPTGLVLISIRCRGVDTAVPLSGIVQSVGYTYAAAWPFALGLLHEGSSTWTPALLLMIALTALAIPAGIVASRPTTVEAEWERKHGSW